MKALMFQPSRILAAALLLSAATLVAQQPYKVLDHWKIGGTGGWDYLTVDSSAHRIYAAHGPRVEVIDTETGKTIGAITGLHGTHGIALDPQGRFGYISDGGGNAVVVFDRSNLSTVATIPAGTNPDGIVYEPTTKTVWAFNGRSKNVSVIDTHTRSVIATIPLPGKPEFPTADGRGHIFDNIEDKNSIAELDAKTKTVTATWALTGCDSPSGMAFDRHHNRIFSVCDSKTMVVLDAATGKQLASPVIGEGPDAAGFSERHDLAFSPNGGDGTLTVIDAARNYAVVETLPTQHGARTMTYDPAADRIYLATAELGPRPEPTATSPRPRPRPAIIPDTYTIVVVGR